LYIIFISCYCIYVFIQPLSGITMSYVRSTVKKLISSYSVLIQDIVGYDHRALYFLSHCRNPLPPPPNWLEIPRLLWWHCAKPVYCQRKHTICRCYIDIPTIVSCPRADLGNNAQYSILDYSAEESQNPTMLVPLIRKRDNRDISTSICSRERFFSYNV